MFERTVYSGLAFILVLFLGVAAPSFGDVITLKTDESFSSMTVLSFDGRRNLFTVERGEKRVEIRAGEVEEIRFDSSLATITLPDESVYSNVEVQSYSGDRGRFTVRRAGRAVDIRAAEIRKIDFRVSGEDEARSVAAAVAGTTSVLPPVLRPIQVEGSTGESAATTTGTETESNAAPEPAAESASETPSAEEGAPLHERARAWEESEGFDESAWSDEDLYSNIDEKMENFEQAGAADPNAPKPYVPRWKGGARRRAANPGRVRPPRPRRLLQNPRRRRPRNPLPSDPPQVEAGRGAVPTAPWPSRTSAEEGTEAARAPPREAGHGRNHRREAVGGGAREAASAGVADTVQADPETGATAAADMAAADMAAAMGRAAMAGEATALAATAAAATAAGMAAAGMAGADTAAATAADTEAARTWARRPCYFLRFRFG